MVLTSTLLATWAPFPAHPTTVRLEQHCLLSWVKFIGSKLKLASLSFAQQSTFKLELFWTINHMQQYKCYGFHVSFLNYHVPGNLKQITHMKKCFLDNYRHGTFTVCGLFILPIFIRKRRCLFLTNTCVYPSCFTILHVKAHIKSNMLIQLCPNWE